MLCDAGVPQGSTQGTLCATYNNLESVKGIFEANKGEIAGVILEPVVGNSGYIEPTKEFLEGLRAMCTDEGAVLCFDEVSNCTLCILLLITFAWNHRVAVL